MLQRQRLRCPNVYPSLVAQFARPGFSLAVKPLSIVREASSGTSHPFRKQLKDKLRQNRDKVTEDGPNPAIDEIDPEVINRWKLTVGIEIHAQLNSDCKLFSRATSVNEGDANSLTADFDLSFPGSQPLFQLPLLIPALRAAAALGCQIQSTSTFDRKHYFYHDQPAGYQITQFYAPFAKDGTITLFSHDGIDPNDGPVVQVGIKQMQLEQDTAKTVQQPPDTVLLDFNRVGYPLVEIISHPHLHSPKTAAAYVRKVSQMLLSVNSVTTGMELGGLRADVNVSIQRKDDLDGTIDNSGNNRLGQRTEIKNLSSFKAVEEAIVAERNRQIALLEAGGEIKGETRGWTIGSAETVRLRSKEGEVDYRYMPDPDIPALRIASDVVQYVQTSLPLIPDLQVQDLIQRCRLSTKDAKTLVALEDGTRVQYFHTVLAHLCERTGMDEGKAGKIVSNWVIHELGGLFGISQEHFDPTRVMPENLSAIIESLHAQEVSGKMAKQLLSMLFAGDSRTVSEIIKQDELALVMISAEQYYHMAATLLQENKDMAEKVRKGQKGKIQWFVGQMMRRSEGKMDAQQAHRAVEQAFNSQSEKLQ